MLQMCYPSPAAEQDLIGLGYSFIRGRISQIIFNCAPELRTNSDRTNIEVMCQGH